MQECRKIDPNCIILCVDKEIVVYEGSHMHKFQSRAHNHIATTETMLAWFGAYRLLYNSITLHYETFVLALTPSMLTTGDPDAGKQLWTGPTLRYITE